MSTKNASKGNTKYPVVDGRKECGACHGVFLVKMFSKQSGIKKGKRYNYGPRTDCKKCRSISSQRYQLEKKIQNYPNQYIDCENEECNWIFRRVRKECPKCKTPN